MNKYKKLSCRMIALASCLAMAVTAIPPMKAEAAFNLKSAGTEIQTDETRDEEILQEELPQEEIPEDAAKDKEPEKEESDKQESEKEEPEEAEPEKEVQKDKPKKKTEKVVATAVMRTGTEGRFHMDDPKGKVKWTIGDKSILQVVKKTKKLCTVKALKDGKTYIKVSDQNATYTFKVVAKTGDAYVKAWCKQWVKTNITDDMSDKQKLITASAFITIYGGFSYGDVHDPADVLTEGVGTCSSGGKLLAAICQAMGYQAKVRFAADDDMSRYPSGVIFAVQHYNVEVIVNGKKYYIDGTPGSGCVYLSTSKKPIYFQVFDQVVQG